MPRSSTKSSVVSSPPEKRVTRGNTEVKSPSTLKSPGRKSIPETPVVGRSRSQSANTKKSSVSSPAAKKIVSPSPKLSRSKRSATLKKPAKSGWSNVSDSEDEVNKSLVQKKGKKTKSSSPATPSQSSKSKKQQKNMKKFPDATVGKRVSPSKSPLKKEEVKRSRSSSKRSSLKSSTPNDQNSLKLRDNNKNGSGDTVNVAERTLLKNTTPEVGKTTSRKRKRDELQEDTIELSDSHPESKTPKIIEETNGNVSEEKREETAQTSVEIEEESKEVNMEKNVVQTEISGPETVDEDEESASNSIDEREYEIISNDDVPPADSDDVILAVEKMVPPPLPIASNTVSGPHGLAAGKDFSDSEVLFTRELVGNPTLVNHKKDPARSFSVVSYNILADVYAQKDFSDGKATWVTNEQLAISSRHVRLMKELEFLNSDIVCFQEVQGNHMTNLLTPDMEAMGYKGLFIPRKIEAYCEGEATFYRSNRFSLVSSQSVVLEDAINEAVDATSLEDGLKEGVKQALKTFAVTMIVRLKLVDSEDEITVANIHVSYDRPARPDRSSIQLAQALQKLIQFSGGIEKPYIICGDFNASPDTATYRFVSSGHLSSDSVNELQAIDSVEQQDKQKVSVVNVWPDGFQFPAGGDLKSAYLTVLGVEPLTSRFTHDGVRCVDYIWFSSVTLDVLEVLKVVDPALIQQGVPNETFPSDHVSLKALLAFK